MDQHRSLVHFLAHVFEGRNLCVLSYLVHSFNEVIIIALKGSFDAFKAFVKIPTCAIYPIFLAFAYV